MDYFTFQAIKQGVPTDVEFAAQEEFWHAVVAHQIAERTRECRSEYQANMLLRRQAA